MQLEINGDGADVHSVQALVDLQAALGLFGHRGLDALQRLRRRFEREVNAVAERCDEAQQAAVECQEALDEADEDDDIDALVDALVEANSTARTARAALARVREAHAGFMQSATRFAMMSESGIRDAQRLVTEKLEILREYEGIQLQALHGGHASRASSIAQSDTALCNGPVTPRMLTEFRLPSGFSWIPLKDIQDDRGMMPIASPSQYEKVSYDTMRAGMTRLREELLPLLQDPLRPTDSERLRLIDKEQGKGYEHGLQRVYEAFFGQHDFVYLERQRGSRLFEVVNGRHRIQLAKELGWEAIPAKIKDLNT